MGSPRCCRQENGTFSSDIHRTWGPPFRPPLYEAKKIMWKGAVNLARGASTALLREINKTEKSENVGGNGRTRLGEQARMGRISGNEVINSCQLCYPHHARAKVVERGMGRGKLQNAGIS